MIGLPIVRRPEGAPSFAPPCPYAYRALRLAEFHGSPAAALAAHDAWESSSLSRVGEGPAARPALSRAEIRAALLNLKETTN